MKIVKGMFYTVQFSNYDMEMLTSVVYISSARLQHVVGNYLSFVIV